MRQRAQRRVWCASWRAVSLTRLGLHGARIDGAHPPQVMRVERINAAKRSDAESRQQRPKASSCSGGDNPEECAMAAGAPIHSLPWRRLPRPVCTWAVTRCDELPRRAPPLRNCLGPDSLPTPWRESGRRLGAEGCPQIELVMPSGGSRREMCAMVRSPKMRWPGRGPCGARGVSEKTEAGKGPSTSTVAGFDCRHRGTAICHRQERDKDGDGEGRTLVGHGGDGDVNASIWNALCM